MDTVGRSMHRRGYRLDALEAPLRETVAAAIVTFFKKRRMLDVECWM